MLITPITFVREMIPMVVILCIVVGSSVVWRRTKRVPALVQLIASVVLLFAWLLDSMRSFTIDRAYDSSWFYRVLWAQSLIDITLPIIQVCIVVFAVAYL